MSETFKMNLHLQKCDEENRFPPDEVIPVQFVCFSVDSVADQ